MAPGRRKLAPKESLTAFKSARRNGWKPYSAPELEGVELDHVRRAKRYLEE
jgi:hypothetical protein